MEKNADLFQEALERWHVCEIAYREARRMYELKFALALLASPQSSAERRKAEAEVASATERIAFDCAEIEARAAEHWMMFLREGDGVAA